MTFPETSEEIIWKYVYVAYNFNFPYFITGSWFYQYPTEHILHRVEDWPVAAMVAVCMVGYISAVKLTSRTKISTLVPSSDTFTFKIGSYHGVLCSTSARSSRITSHCHNSLPSKEPFKRATKLTTFLQHISFENACVIFGPLLCKPWLIINCLPGYIEETLDSCSYHNYPLNFSEHLR